jgi:hypothetical protein
MKLFLLPVLLAAALCAAAAEPASLTGQWTVKTAVMGNENESQCRLEQQGEELSGACETRRGKVEVRGHVKGAEVRWSYKAEYEGNPLTVVYKGKIEAPGKLAGAVTVDEYSIEGEFTATLAP